MASPQWEEGYTKIANEIMKALMRTNLSAYQSRILWVIFRKTYGWKKKEDWIANKQLIDMTGIRKQHISRTLKELKDRNIVTKSGYKTAFNKDYTQWRELPKQVTVTNSGYKKVTDSGSKVTNSGEHKRNYTKERRNAGKNPAVKTSPKKPTGDKDKRVKTIIDYFHETVLKERGYKPRINGAASGQIIKQCLKDMTEDEIKRCIEYYVNSKKERELGMSLSIALSAHSINLYRQHWQKEKELYA